MKLSVFSNFRKTYCLGVLTKQVRKVAPTVSAAVAACVPPPLFAEIQRFVNQRTPPRRTAQAAVETTALPFSNLFCQYT